jgi:alcohol dehydrogenase class IV
VTDTDFTWIDGERLIRLGEGALEESPELLHRRGFDGYALLTTERAAEQAPELARRAATVVHVPSGPVPGAAAAVRERVARRPVVALGGGRVVDSAKAVAAVDRSTCAAIPTTLSGAEMTPFHRLPEGAEARSLVRPSVVVAEPELMASLRQERLAASAMNALAHAAEALWVSHANPVAELAALRAAELIASGLKSDPPSRPELALGAILAGYAVGTTGFGLLHVTCQTIVRTAGTPHAATYAVMLPHVLRVMEPRSPEALGRLAAALGAERAAAGDAAERVATLAARAGARSLSDLGVEESMLGAIAAGASGRPELDQTPDPPGEGQLLDLLRTALD